MIYSEGLSVPEGPVVLNDGSWLVVEMGPERGCVTHITNDGKDKRVVAKTGRPNGLAIDEDQNIWCAESKKLDTGIQFTNGIAFGPDNDLYVNETITGNIFRYKYENGQIGPRTLFGNVIAPDAPEGIKGPDGMKFGQDGNLYVTVFAQGDVTVLGADGNVLRRIKTDGVFPTNLAFGLPGDRRIYVTEDEKGTLEVFDIGCDGLPLYYGARQQQA